MHLFIIVDRKLQCKNELIKYMAYNVFTSQKHKNMNNINNIYSLSYRFKRILIQNFLIKINVFQTL